ncbi:MAG: YcaQ family DNA glycosylase [Microthrixaceae bacterium]|nr:YcaQ family DNA glycosylase [Microthrixaceae bacterium]
MSGSEARRLALAAQGFCDKRTSSQVDRRHGRRVLDRVGVIQIDSVNVVCRSQELALLARLGSHPRDLVPRMTDSGDLFEYWAHEASHLRPSMHRLLRWRMDDARDGRGTWGRVAAIARERPDLVASMYRQVSERGPVTVSEVEGTGERTTGMWGWSPGKVALEYLFWSGQISARRGPNFERRYDLPERMLPAGVLDQPTPTRSEAMKELLAHAARAHGVGTARDLADYFRLPIREARPLLAELVEEGVVLPAVVENWREPAFRHAGAVLPREVSVRALLSPFDSLIWERSRVERIWGFRYRVEIYVPADRRVHGYYVLPFLLGDSLVARVDLKADRAARLLRVRAAHLEVDSRAVDVAVALAEELAGLASFLGLEGVVVEPAGDLAPELGRAVAGVVT